jgi:cytochrome c oxidase subunit 2
VAAAVLTGCGANLKQSPFDPHGDVIRMQMSLLKMSLWFAIAIGAFVTVALLYVVFRFRQKPGQENVVPKQIHGSTVLEITWTLIPIIILAIVAVPTVRTAFATKSSKDPKALQVKVVGNQWWWGFEYPEYGIVTANELVIPVGKDVAATLVSNDVIHSFWIPKLAGKMDVIPGRENHMWFNAEDADLYWGQCAEFCGASHANMRFRVRAVSQQEFDAWVKDRQAGAKTPTDPDALAGMELFMGKIPGHASCYVCHTVDGTKAKGTVGPNLSNIGSRPTIGAGLIDNDPEGNALRAWVRNAPSIKPGIVMPAHPNLTDQELNQVVKYLQSLK